MKIAIIYQERSLGGGIRFLKSLLFSLVKNYPNLEVTLFISKRYEKEENLNVLFKNFSNLKIRAVEFYDPLELSFLKKIKKRVIGLSKKLHLYHFLKLVQSFLHFSLGEKNRSTPEFSIEITNELKKFDLIYLPWPYLLRSLKVEVPIVGTFHDFNYKHDFGNFLESDAKMIHNEIEELLKQCKIAVVSSDFIKSEMTKFYPFSNKKAQVLYLSDFVIKNHISDLNLMEKFKLPAKFVVCPSNTAYHKNHINLIKAFGLLKKENFKIPLVLAGNYTNNISLVYQKKQPTVWIQHFFTLADLIKENNLILDKDIFILGYVSDDEVYELIKRAELVVSPSLYEAGSGPGLDSWKIGAPIAFSDIPSHINQLNFLKTKAWVFNPLDPEDIAMTIKKAVILEKDKTLEMVNSSKEAMDKYTWDDVAKQYYEVFQRAAKL